MKILPIIVASLFCQQPVAKNGYDMGGFRTGELAAKPYDGYVSVNLWVDAGTAREFIVFSSYRGGLVVIEREPGKDVVK